MIAGDEAPGTRAVDAPPSLPGLTSRQAEILREIARLASVPGVECRASYVARRMNMSRDAIRVHAEALARKGWLRSSESPFRLRRSV